MQRPVLVELLTCLTVLKMPFLLKATQQGTVWIRHHGIFSD